MIHSHARPRAAGECHPASHQHCFLRQASERRDLQVRVNSGDARFLKSLRQMAEPPFRLPLVRILSPEHLVPIARLQVGDDGRAPRYKQFADLRTVLRLYWRRKRERDVPRSTSAMTHQVI